MPDIWSILDATMGVLWIVTYTLVLIGSIKYGYPLIAPMAQAIIAPYEFSVLFLMMKWGRFGMNYVSVAYLYWTLIEISIIFVTIKSGFLKRRVPIYLSFIVLMTGVMFYLVTIKEYMLFFSYLNTFVGVAVWFIFILNKNYPMRPISLAIFCVKFLADILSAILYIDEGGSFINILCILLPTLDFLFIIVYIKRMIELKQRRRLCAEKQTMTI